MMFEVKTHLAIYVLLLLYSVLHYILQDTYKGFTTYWHVVVPSVAALIMFVVCEIAAWTIYFGFVA